MKLVTVATSNGGYFSFLKKSCKRYHAELIVLGWGEKWTGFSMKFRLMIDFLKKTNPDEIICFIDAYDVLLLRPLDELESFFISFSSTMKSKIIVGCDKSHWMTNLLSSNVFGRIHDKILNSGTYIGYAKDILTILSKSYDSTSNDDQILLNKYCKINPHDIHIDSDSLFFLTINRPLGTFITKDMMIKDQTLFYQGVTPFIAHGNGNTDMMELLTLLGYKVRLFEKSKVSRFKKKELFKKTLHFLPYFYKLFIVLLLTVIIIFMILRRKRKS